MSFFPRELGAPALKSAPLVEWEETPCPMCASGNWSQLVEAADSRAGVGALWFAVVQCQECGLCFTNPRPSAESIGQFYPADYAPHQRRRSRPSGWTRFRPGRRERLILPLSDKGRLLDFGCGDGGFLERMQCRGWDVIGLDQSSAVVERLRSDLRLEAFAGSLPHPNLESARFDLITMWHALEHVHDPLLVLREARRLLEPAGKLVVAVPNIDSLAFRWFGNAWFGLDLPRHLTHFTPWTLPQMLQLAGFRPGPVRMMRRSKWLRASAQLAARDPRRPYWHRWLQSRIPSRLVTWFSALTFQADCIVCIAEPR